MHLRPETPAPQFHAAVASALILPFDSLRSSGTEPGDQIIVCSEEELETQLAKTSGARVAEPIVPIDDAPVAKANLPLPALPQLPINPFPSPPPPSQASVQTFAASVPQRIGFTVGMTSSSWQISTSTMTTAAVLEPGEFHEPEAVREKRIQEEVPESEKTEETAHANTGNPQPQEGQDASAGRPEAIGTQLELLEEQHAVKESTRAKEQKHEVSPIASKTTQVVEQTTVPAGVPERDTPVPKRKDTAEDLAATIGPPASAATSKRKPGKKRKNPWGFL